MGLGGGLLAAIFVTEALVHGGFFVPYAVGVFVMVGLCARFFGKVRLPVYIAATLGLTALLLLIGIP
ncbi:MAG: hypothetical protein OK442_03440 [Thaumarchaeota archaeon]|nr:hypothetical protein [Nitrososphaerota archaeon]